MENITTTFKQGFCPPVIIYLGLTIINIVAKFIQLRREPRKSNTADMLQHVVQQFLFGGLLWFLCYQGYNNISWGLLLFPVIIFILIVTAIIAVDATEGNLKHSK